MADALSRMSADQPIIFEVNLFCLYILSQELADVIPNQWNQEQRNYDSLKPYFNTLEEIVDSEEGVKGSKGIHQCCLIDNGILMKNIFYDGKWRIVVPISLQKEGFFYGLHDARGHFGTRETHHLIAKYFYWEIMREDVLAHVRDCIPYTRTKTSMWQIQ